MAASSGPAAVVALLLDGGASKTAKDKARRAARAASCDVIS
jgi:hypothetical protein